MARTLKTAGKRCRDCQHPVKNHWHGDSSAKDLADRYGTACGCGCPKAR